MAPQVRRLEAGDAGQRVAHGVGSQLGPPLAPQVGRGLRGPSRRHHLGNTLQTLSDPPARLAQDERVPLHVAGPRHAAGLINPCAQRNDATHDAGPSDDPRDSLFVDAVLRRHDESAGRQVRLRERGGPLRVVGLYRKHNGVERPPGRRHLAQMQGRGLDGELLLHGGYLEALGPDALDIGRPRVDQRDVSPRPSQVGADHAAYGPDSQYCDSHGSLPTCGIMGRARAAPSRGILSGTKTASQPAWPT